MTVMTHRDSRAETHHAAARKAMIDCQLRPSGVNDSVVLAAMGLLPREDFVPAARAGVAYADRAIPLGGGRTLAPAVSHGWMLEEAQPVAKDTALLIGGASGYLAALLAPLVGSLAVVESDATLAGSAPVRAGNWHEGPLEGGHPQTAPYSLIVIDGAIEQVPPALAAQLADDGRMLTGLIERGIPRLALGRRSGTGVAFVTLGEIDLAPLAAFAAARSWSF